MESACANKVGWKITGRGLCPTVGIILADNENVYVKNQIPLFHPPARHSRRKSKLAEKLVNLFACFQNKSLIFLATIFSTHFLACLQGSIWCFLFNGNPFVDSFKVSNTFKVFQNSMKPHDLKIKILTLTVFVVESSILGACNVSKQIERTPSTPTITSKQGL